VPACLTYDQLLRNTAIATLTALVDRDIAGPIAMKNEGYDDFCLWLSILKPGHVAWGLNEDLARYRVRGVSVSSRRMRAAGWVWYPQRRTALFGQIDMVLCALGRTRLAKTGVSFNGI
jgi:teichuronic acid biosynthesis glycosyltransferase TuaG